MRRKTRFFFTVIQFALLIDNTQQSKIKQGINTLKAFGNTMKSPQIQTIGNTINKPIIKIISNTIKNSVRMYRRNKNTIKNLAFGLQEKYLITKHNFGIKPIKYLGKESIKKFKYMTPQAAKKGNPLVGTASKQSIYMRSVAQMNGKSLRNLAKRSSKQIVGKELESLVNMVSKSKPQLPFLLVTGGLSNLRHYAKKPYDPYLKIAWKTEEKDRFDDYTDEKRGNMFYTETDPEFLKKEDDKVDFTEPKKSLWTRSCEFMQSKKGIKLKSIIISSIPIMSFILGTAIWINFPETRLVGDNKFDHEVITFRQPDSKFYYKNPNPGSEYIVNKKDLPNGGKVIRSPKIKNQKIYPRKNPEKRLLLTDRKTSRTKLKFFDIGANLSSMQFKGWYAGYAHHVDDIFDVFKRAKLYGVDKFINASEYVLDSEDCELIMDGRTDCYTTVGVSPSFIHFVEYDDKRGSGKAEDYYQKMDDMIVHLGRKCVAVGICGLDYDRQGNCDIDTPIELQLKHFPIHFDLAEKYKLPMYFHNRNSNGDFVRIVKENRHRFPGGVVHSFAGDKEELDQILDMDLHVGVSGCSMKTEESIEMVKKIPLDRLMLETNSPYCEIRKTHFSNQYIKTDIEEVDKRSWHPYFMVKGRNEPCRMIQVCEAVAAIKGISEEEVAKVTYDNAYKLFVNKKK